MVKNKNTGRRTRRKTTKGDPLCSFCGKHHNAVAKLVAGPGAYICNECVGLCNEILASPEGQNHKGGWQGWNSMSDEDLLAALPGGLRTVESVHEGVQARIDELRKRAVSWARIGETLGMSRQAAWERFS